MARHNEHVERRDARRVTRTSARAVPRHRPASRGEARMFSFSPSDIIFAIGDNSRLLASEAEILRENDHFIRVSASATRGSRRE
jgi:hypothetical protein